MAKKPAKKKKHAGGRPPKGDKKLVTVATRVRIQVRQRLEEKAEALSAKLDKKVTLSQYLRRMCSADAQSDNFPVVKKARA